MLSGGPSGDSEDLAERTAAVALVAIAALSVLVLATGHLSALVFGGGWPRYRLADTPGILGRFVTDPLDPGGAWAPVNEGAEVPGAVAWWLTLVVPLALGAAAIVAVRRRAARRAQAGAAAVRAREVRRRQLTRSLPDDLVVGTAGGQEVAIRDRRSLLVLGPLRSGRTSAMAVPAVLEWPGPVVATCTGDDLVTHTIGWRSRLGDVHVFDPARTTRHHPSGWSPLSACHTWDGALATAWDLVMGAKAAVGTASGIGDMWFSSAPRSLAPYLLAAATSSRTMADVARWVDTEERDEAMGVVRSLDPDAAVALAGTFRRDPAVRASLFHVMGLVARAYLDPTVVASARDHEVEPAELLDGDPHTLYVVAPHHDQARLRPVFATLVRQVLTAVHEQVAPRAQAAGRPAAPAARRRRGRGAARRPGHAGGRGGGGRRAAGDRVPRPGRGGRPPRGRRAGGGGQPPGQAPPARGGGARRRRRPGGGPGHRVDRRGRRRAGRRRRSRTSRPATRATGRGPDRAGRRAGPGPAGQRGDPAGRRPGAAADAAAARGSAAGRCGAGPAPRRTRCWSTTRSRSRPSPPSPAQPWATATTTTAFRPPVSWPGPAPVLDNVAELDAHRARRRRAEATDEA